MPKDHRDPARSRPRPVVAPAAPVPVKAKAKPGNVRKPSAKKPRAKDKKSAVPKPVKNALTDRKRRKSITPKPADRRGTPKGQATRAGGPGRGGKKPRGRIGNPPFKATDEQRIEVCAMVAAGADQEIIADIMGFSVDTLQRHFRVELNRGAERLLGRIGGSMFRDALDPNKPNYHDARKYVLARRGGWKTTTAVEASGPGGGPIEYRSLSDEEIDARIDALMAGNVAARPAKK